MLKQHPHGPVVAMVGPALGLAFVRRPGCCQQAGVHLLQEQALKGKLLLLPSGVCLRWWPWSRGCEVHLEMLCGFRFKWSLGRKILRGRGDRTQPASPCCCCEADCKTNLSYFYTKNRRVNSGAVIQHILLRVPNSCLSGWNSVWLWPGCTKTQLCTACPTAPAHPTNAGGDHENNPACSSFLCLEFGTHRICNSTILLIQCLKRALEELSCWLRWRKGMAFLQLAAFS